MTNPTPGELAEAQRTLDAINAAEGINLRLAETVTVQAITREHLTTEHGTARWGGPTAKVTVNAGPLAGRAFWLRSTEGLDDNINPRKGGGIHMDAADPDDGGRHDWRGAFRTHDMGEAIDSLVTYINDLAERQRIQDATWAESSALTEAWQAFSDALDESSPRDFRAEWVRVRQAVAAMEMTMTEAGRG